MTEKQLGNAAVRGRMITFARAGEQPITGYLGGLDADFFLVIMPEKDNLRTFLVNRLDSPWQEIHPEPTLDSEAHRESIEAIVGPFSAWLQDHLLNMPQKTR